MRLLFFQIRGKLQLFLLNSTNAEFIFTNNYVQLIVYIFQIEKLSLFLYVKSMKSFNSIKDKTELLKSFQKFVLFLNF